MNDYYLNLIEQNTDNTFRVADRIENEIINLKAIEYNTQAIMTSGDNQIIENQKQIQNWLCLQSIIIMGILLYLFIVRSLK